MRLCNGVFGVAVAVPFRAKRLQFDFAPLGV